MSREAVDPSQVAAIEARVDKTYWERTPTARSTATAMWRTLVVGEDVLRGVIVEDREASVYRLFHLIDRTKYALKWALSAALRVAPPGDLPHPVPDVTEAEYTEHANFHITSYVYQEIAGAFALYHSGRSACERRRNSVRFRLDDEMAKLMVQEAVETASPKDVPLRPLFDWMRGRPDTVPMLKGWAKNGVRCSDDSVAYTRDTEAVVAIRSAMPEPVRVLPASWSWRGIAAPEIRDILHSLQALCLHHVVMNFHVARELGMTGAAISSVPLLIGNEELVRTVAAVSRVPGERVRTVMSVLRYGDGVTSPDPSLQPLVRVRASDYAIPALLTASNAMERNFLTLLARSAQPEFDAASHHFEREMTTVAASGLSSKRWAFRTGFNIPGRREVGDVDLLIVDAASLHVLVCELRWMLPPGEVREVSNRIGAIPGKVEQARRKAAAVREVLPKVLAAVVPGATEAGWTVEGLVMLDGYVGRPEPQVPVITRRAFEACAAKFDSISDMLVWIRSGALEPREGWHYVRSWVPITLGDVTIQRQAVRLLPRAAELLGERNMTFDL
jgi:hypothetical protein